MSGTNLTQVIPIPTAPLYNDISGVMSLVWYNFFLSLWNRTGGAIPGGAGVPGGASGNIQYNNGGSFGGLSNIQVTTRIQNFTDVLSGAVPASGGGSTKFLRADGAFSGVNAINGVSYPASPTTNRVPVVTAPNTVTYEVVPVVAGGTGVAAGTDGGILGFTTSTSLTSSSLLVNHAIMVGGGVGATPGTIASTGTATTLLHGNVAGDPTFSAVDLVADVSGTLDVTNGGTGVTTSTGTPGDTVLSINPTLAGVTVDGDLALTSQVDGAGVALGTLTNAPTAGNPTFWLQVKINGSTLKVPAWA